MNIFILDIDPFKSAQMLCNSHVVKMIVESCQLLSTHDRLNGLNDGRYKITHINHPCRKCLSNKYNYIWLQYHLFGLLKEYKYRYNKIHKCQNIYEKYWKRIDDETLFNAINQKDKINFTENYSELIDLTSFPQCMPNEFKNNSNDIFNVIKAYKEYYKFKSKSLKRFNFTNRQNSWE